MHPCEDDIVCKCTTDENKVPYFNAPVYLENKEQIGKVDEIFGQLRDFVSFSCCVNHSVGPLCKRVFKALILNLLMQYFSVKLSENMKASSFKKLQKVKQSAGKHFCLCVL